MGLLARETRVVEGIAPDAVPWDELMGQGRPAILRGLVGNWPLARAESPARAAAYLLSFYQGRPVTVFIARPELKGRFSYTADATRLDFTSEQGPLGDYLDRILAHLDDPAAPS